MAAAQIMSTNRTATQAAAMIPTPTVPAPSA